MDNCIRVDPLPPVLGWLHVNADWVLLEAVDRGYRPTPPGEASHTVLLSNLGNRVRRSYGTTWATASLSRPSHVPATTPLPAVRVEGRRDDVLSMRAPDGRFVRLLPLALTTIVEAATRVHRFQIVQTAADRLILRIEPGRNVDRHAVWHSAADALRGYLAQQSLPSVHVALDGHGPLTDRRSSKLREVIVAMERSPVHA